LVRLARLAQTVANQRKPRGVCRLADAEFDGTGAEAQKGLAVGFFDHRTNSLAAIQHTAPIAKLIHLPDAAA
jgi:hypothetical protein